MKPGDMVKLQLGYNFAYLFDKDEDKIVGQVIHNELFLVLGIKNHILIKVLTSAGQVALIRKDRFCAAW